MANIEFKDNSINVKGRLDDIAIQFLEDGKNSIASQASKLSPVDTGALKASFQTDSFVDESEYTAYIGSSLEYAIWQEMGTGEYAVNGNGRKGGWAYEDPKTGETVWTHGTHPKRMLYHAFQEKKETVKNRGRKLFGEI